MTVTNCYEETVYYACSHALTVEDVCYGHKTEHQHTIILHKPKSA